MPSRCRRESLRRPITLTVASLAALTYLAYLVYQRYKNPQSEPPPSPSLHRSNAHQRPLTAGMSPESRKTVPLVMPYRCCLRRSTEFPDLVNTSPELPEEAHMGEGASLDLIPSNLRSLCSYEGVQTLRVGRVEALGRACHASMYAHPKIGT